MVDDVGAPDVICLQRKYVVIYSAGYHYCGVVMITMHSHVHM